MEPLLASAREAIALGGQEPNANGQLDGHVIIHWSHYLLLGTGIVGLVTSVAAAILTQWPLVVATGILSATSFIGSYYIKELGVAKALEQIIQDLVTTIHNLYLQTITLQSQITELNTSKEDLKKVVDGYENGVKKSQDRIDDQTKKLQTLADQLKASEAKFAELKALYDPLKATVDQFVDTSSQLLTTVGDLQTKECGLKASAATLNQIEEKLDKDVNQIAVNAGTLASENKLALNYVTKLTKVVGFFHRVYPQLVKENELQQKELAELRLLQKEQTETVSTLKHSLEDYQKRVTPLIQELLSKLPVEMIHQLNQQLANLK